MEVTVPKRAIEGLSVDALGVLVKMICFASDPTQKHISNVSGFGINKARRIQTELIREGFITKECGKDAQGRFASGAVRLSVQP